MNLSNLPPISNKYNILELLKFGADAPQMVSGMEMPVRPPAVGGMFQTEVPYLRASPSSPIPTGAVSPSQALVSLRGQPAPLNLEAFGQRLNNILSNTQVRPPLNPGAIKAPEFLDMLMGSLQKGGSMLKGASNLVGNLPGVAPLTQFAGPVLGTVGNLAAPVTMLSAALGDMVTQLQTKNYDPISPLKMAGQAGADFVVDPIDQLLGLFGRGIDRNEPAPQMTPEMMKEYYDTKTKEATDAGYKPDYTQLFSETPLTFRPKMEAEVAQRELASRMQNPDLFVQAASAIDTLASGMSRGKKHIEDTIRAQAGLELIQRGMSPVWVNDWLQKHSFPQQKARDIQEETSKEDRKAEAQALYGTAAQQARAEQELVREANKLKGKMKVTPEQVPLSEVQGKYQQVIDPRTGKPTGMVLPLEPQPSWMGSLRQMVPGIPLLGQDPRPPIEYPTRATPIEELYRAMKQGTSAGPRIRVTAQGFERIQ